MVDYARFRVGAQWMQDAIDAVNAAGGLCFIAHPYWHDHTLDDLLSLHGHIGIEIFNTGCWLEINKGHSLVHWDGVLRRGQRSVGWLSYPLTAKNERPVMQTEARR